MAILGSLLLPLGLFLCLGLLCSPASCISHNGNCMLFNKVIVATYSEIHANPNVYRSNTVYTVSVPVNKNITSVILRAIDQDNSLIGSWQKADKYCSSSVLYHMKSRYSKLFEAKWVSPSFMNITTVELQYQLSLPAPRGLHKISSTPYPVPCGKQKPIPGGLRFSWSLVAPDAGFLKSCFHSTPQRHGYGRTTSDLTTKISTIKPTTATTPIPTHKLTTTPTHKLTTSPIHKLNTSPIHKLTTTPTHKLATTPTHKLTTTLTHKLATTPTHKLTTTLTHKLTTTPTQELTTIHKITTTHKLTTTQTTAKSLANRAFLSPMRDAIQILLVFLTSKLLF
ncbi:placenta-expressed transcript 1 protein [Lagenorhynchus albirostris]|uniref:placenta-expressed transcript 1 protein n=1 Tax=Lagenorhynchus albirostris TaxID=27610 RepID=UPI0028E4245C|nr:placenta-expressed transcript 1 protein [Lagenorhynchus albirostris]